LAAANTRKRRQKICLRGRLHVSESAYESPYDSVHDLYANRIGIQFFFRHPLQWFVYTFQKKNQKVTGWTPFAANRTPNRMGIRMENRTCRRPLTLNERATTYFSRQLNSKGPFPLRLFLAQRQRWFRFPSVSGWICKSQM
jgi:hypothetical protein